MKKDTTETALITGSYGGLGRCFAALHAVRMATNEQIKTFSPPIFAAYCSKDGRTCIARLAAYKRLIGPMRYAIEETADACTVTLRPGDRVRILADGFPALENPVVAEGELA